MQPLLADAIDLPLVLIYGLAVLAPLLLFQVGVEALVLQAVWRIRVGELFRFVFRANCWSLAAGVPTKILNAFLYAWWLPRDIPSFFAWYPAAVAAGTLIYFLVTVLVELACAARWKPAGKAPLPGRTRWMGILAANVATYAVLGPLHYYATLPTSEVREFTQDVKWSTHPETAVVYVDSDDSHLKLIRLDGSPARTIVPATVKDYLISSDTTVCLYRGEAGALVLYQPSSASSHLVLKTDERFRMNQVAFSPSAAFVAFASEKDGFIEVVDVRAGRRTRQPLHPSARGANALDVNVNVAWSPEEHRFYFSLGRGERFTVNIDPDFALKIEALRGKSAPLVSACHGRTGPHQWSGGSEWGVTFGEDTCQDLRARVVHGLGAGLWVERGGGDLGEQVFALAIDPGLLHLSSVGFQDVAFLDGCTECLFEADGRIYLVDLDQQRLGPVANGTRFALLTPRYRKFL